ncbi:MAG: hypothetical protein HY040_26515 [Planctomycetes bacterium]|nr:hypothetical protein [Planctomycetota bacterium]
MAKLKLKKETIRVQTVCVQTDGKRHYINVPAGRALDLHNYLRSNRVRSAPPEPAFTGFDSIELAKDIDVENIQILLKAWK